MDVNQLAQYLAISKALNNRLPFHSCLCSSGTQLNAALRPCVSSDLKYCSINPLTFSHFLSVSAAADPGPRLDWLPRVRDRLVLRVT